jgi:Zn-finger nucleic acid-binding protein
MGRVRANVHQELGEKLLDLADVLLGICPNCGGWIHKKQLYKLLTIKRGKYYGQRDCMSLDAHDCDYSFLKPGSAY